MATKSDGRGKNRLRPFESLYKRLVKSAQEREIEVALSYHQFLLFTDTEECHYCGASVFWQQYTGHRLHGRGVATNLDRKDNDEGYSPENCVVCCARCNRGKRSDFSYDEWVVMAAALKEYRNDHRL